MRTNGLQRSAEWLDFEANAVDLRRRLARTLRRELVHDDRAASVRLQNVAAADLADEAITWALENWKAKPAAIPPEQWVRKHALQLLDEALDQETLAAESRAEERAAESRVLLHELPRDDDERAEWVDMAQMATRPGPTDADGDGDPFDRLASDPMLSSPEARIGEREMLVQLERALLGLPPRCRKVVAHRFLDGLSVEEIAYLLDTTEPAVRLDLETGLRSLQLTLAEA